MPDLVRFEKIVGEGKALGYLDGRACFAVGPLPGETARVEVVKAKKNYVEAVVREIVEPSPGRGETREDHYILCSPWQGVDYDYQLELKRGMLEEIFGRPELELPVDDVVGSEKTLGYRNKLEFALRDDGSGKLQLAFHDRGSHEGLVVAPKGCVLGSAEMNVAALALLEQLNGLELVGFAESLMIRQSQSSGRMIGVVGLREVPKRDWSSLAVPELAGVVVSRVKPGHRHELVRSRGETELEETVGGVMMRYPFDGFFQVNVPVFERALEQMVAAVPASARVVDLYGGVGAIGLPVAARVAGRVTGVEINASSVELAAANADRAGLANYEAMALPAERLDAGVLKGADVVIVDPPRAGLDERVIASLLEAMPARIVYLSCNPVTQARDLMRLGQAYRSSGVTGFDFYPGTLHVESLVLLERI